MSGTRGAPLPFSCTCGKLQGQITASGVSSGTHVVCYCRDCRAGQLYFGQPDPAPGPVNIYHLSPEAIQISTGAEYLAAMRLSPKGMYRWYAKCCKAPIATTTTTPKFPFAGFDVNRIADKDRLRPVSTRGFVPQPNGRQKHEKLMSAASGLLGRVIKSRVSGSWRKTPFFDPDTGEPVATPTVLDRAERATYYD